MVGETGAKDEKQARALALALVVLVIVGGVAALFALPALAEFSATYLAPGIGLKTAAVLSFLATVVTMIVFAVAAGDGLIGEIQFMLVGFFAFFVVLWLLIAWVF